ncbi:MAG: nucleotidyltransferase family protein [Bacteroidota bacterium]|nr:nucleotidyltransferase family protein [Bacteroidota bacterium]
MTGAIILAAGASTRMGQPKQLLDIHGTSLLQKAISAFAGARIDSIAVVLGYSHYHFRETVKSETADVIVNDDWQRGMGSSIKTGLRHLLEQKPDLDNVVIAVCDQPYLDSDLIESLLQTHDETGKPITASFYAGMPGVPALFDKSYFEKISSIADDVGAKKLIVENPSDVVLVPFPGGDVDLDTMEDYLNFIRNKENGS